MTNWFVDTGLASGDNDGSTTDHAWQSYLTAFAYAGFTPGDRVWFKRDSTYGGGANLALGDAGTATDTLSFIGWPRQVILNISITEATFTNGSNLVDAIVGITITRTKHQGRFLTAPDGEQYLITQCPVAANADALYIDREYAGPTVSTTNGKFQIEADEDYTEAQAIDDSAWTIKLSTWSDDADDLPVIDFADGAYYIFGGADKFYYIFKNFEIRDTTSSYGLIRNNYTGPTTLQGCLLYTDQNTNILIPGEGGFIIGRTILEGSGAGSSQRGLDCGTGSTSRLKNVAIINTGDNGIFSEGGAYITLDNVNIGVELPCGDYDISLYRGSTIMIGKDVSLGGDTGVLAIYAGRIGDHVSIAIENYNKVLGEHMTFTKEGTVASQIAGGGGTIPNLRSGGASKLVECFFNRNNVEKAPAENIALPIFTHEFEATTDSKSYRYYVQSMAILTAAQLWIEVEYVSGYDDTTEYVFSTQKSDETFTVRADASDWAEYMEVTGIQPAIGSKVRIKCYCAYYHATNKIYIDPMCVIS